MCRKTKLCEYKIRMLFPFYYVRPLSVHPGIVNLLSSISVNKLVTNADQKLRCEMPHCTDALCKMHHRKAEKLGLEMSFLMKFPSRITRKKVAGYTRYLFIEYRFRLFNDTFISIFLLLSFAHILIKVKV